MSTNGAAASNTVDDTSADSLSQLFDRGSALHRQVVDPADVDPRSAAFAARCRKCVLILEDATRLVSVLDLFSSNESVSEIPTEHLKYLLLPALLGDVHGRLVDDGQDREEVIRVQEVYFRDFLQRCKDYDIVDVELPEKDEDEEDEDARPAPRPPGPPDLARMNKEREAKLRRYKERTELEARLKELEAAAEAGTADEDQQRELRLGSIRRAASNSLDELASFRQERPILRHMKKVRAGKAPPRPPAEQQPPRPLKPIIITRDAAQKEVFGLGYKNVPVLSIEEFYEQRVRDGWFPKPGQQQKSLQGMTEVDQKEQEEAEAAEAERKEEEDDGEELARKRRMDEYRDDHRRGEGNRHNMG